MTNKPPRSTAHVEPLLLKLHARDILSDEEKDVLRDSISDVREIAAGKTIIRAGVLLNECTLLCEGFICRYKDLADGQRQIQELHVPGDFLDLHSFLLKRLEHNVGTLSKVKIATVPHDAVRAISEKYPHLTRILWFSTLLDAAINRESILSVGRRTALARVAHLLCEVKARLDLVDLVKDGRYQFPLTQADIADATGLTSVHVNRMLKKLRDDKILTFRGGEVVLHDWEKLQRIAEFDPAYLYLERRPM